MNNRSHTNNDNQNNSAFFAFLYALSLIALAFTSISAGIIIFKIIDKLIPPVINGRSFYGCDSGRLKFAIAALITTSPIYFITLKIINKNISAGKIKETSQIRKWLTYFILLTSSAVIIGNLISVIFNFLNGDFTSSFLLKTLTIFIISGIILSYYFYDIKRKITVGEKNKIARIYFYSSLIIIITVFVSALTISETPSQSRNRKYDQQTAMNLDSINMEISQYYIKNNNIPETLTQLLSDSLKYELDEDTIKNIEYKRISENKFQLCANFKTSNKDNSMCRDWLADQWQHDKGRKCFDKEVKNIPTL